jgi:superfamily II DNA or RNA helicase
MYSKAFRTGRWSGVQQLLSGSLKFPGGLRAKVEEFYQHQNRPLETEDLRPPKSPNQKIDILPKLKALGIEPRDYQLATVNVVDQVSTGIIKIATGGGKTAICAMITAHFGKRTIIYVVGNDLLHQTHKFFTKVFNQKIGKIGDGICDIKDITIASVWTIGKALGVENVFIDSEDKEDEVGIDVSKYEEILAYLKTVKVHIIDECHQSSCSSIQTLVKTIEAEHIYGMSASPVRDDNSDLLIEAALGRTIVDYPATYLIEKGYLTQPTIKFITVPKYPEPLKKNYHTIYSKYIIENEVRNKLVVDWAKKFVDLGYPTLVLFNNIKHGKILYEIMKDLLPCALLSGKDDSEERDIVKEQLESGKIKCIIASRIFDQGVDIPMLSGLVLAGAGKSSVRALQRVGRVLRIYPGKNRAVIAEFQDSCHYLKDHAKARRKIYEMEPGFILK